MSVLMQIYTLLYWEYFVKFLLMKHREDLYLTILSLKKISHNKNIIHLIVCKFISCQTLEQTYKLGVYKLQVKQSWLESQSNNSGSCQKIQTEQPAHNHQAVYRQQNFLLETSKEELEWEMDQLLCSPAN